MKRYIVVLLFTTCGEGVSEMVHNCERATKWEALAEASGALWATHNDATIIESRIFKQVKKLTW